MTYTCVLCKRHQASSRIRRHEVQRRSVCNTCALKFKSFARLQSAVQKVINEEALLARPHGVNPKEDKRALRIYVQQSQRERDAEDAALVDDANREMFGDEVADLIDLGILPDNMGDK